jgi:hypothetical protein
MEPTVPKTTESWSLLFTVLNTCGSALAGLLGAVWYMRGVKDDQEALKDLVREHHTVIFKERGGLAFLTPDEHARICQASQEAFGKDLELMAKDISHVKDILTKIEKNSGIEELKDMRLLMQGIARQLESLHTKRPHS